VAAARAALHVAASARTPLPALVEAFFRAEVVERTCAAAGCDGGTARVTHRVARPPRALVLHIKRFVAAADGGGASASGAQWAMHKRHNRVAIPQAFSLAPFVDTLTSEEEMLHASQDSGDEAAAVDAAAAAAATAAPRYALRSVISHLGVSAACGHFVADIFAPELRCWIRHDDALVKPVSTREVFTPRMESDAYILVYELQDAEGGPVHPCLPGSETNMRA
jgi:ubiquitin C-terminal hydrolase